MTDQGTRYRGDRIRVYLTAQGRKQRWVAAQLGVSESMVSHVIAGRKTLRRPDAERVSLLLGVPFGVLFDSLERDDASPVGDTA